MSIPKVSVIMPVYNTEKYLKEAIESVLKQTLQDWELILVNDGSTDNSLSILEYYTSVDERITLLNQSNQGLSAARNTGIVQAKGRYLYFLDSDDYIVPHALLLCYTHSISNKIDFLFFDADTFFDGNNDGSHFFNYKRTLSKPNHICNGLIMLNELLLNDEYLVSVCLLFISREVLEVNNLLFYRGIVHEDELFTTELFLKANRVMYLQESLFVRRVREDSIMTVPIKMSNIKSYFIVANRIKELVKYNPSYKNVIDLYLKKLLNAVLWKAHVMPLKDRIEIFSRAMWHWYSYIDMRSFFVLLLRKYISRK